MSIKDKLSESSNPVKVVIWNEFFYPDTFGGTATATSNLARSFVDDHGFDVTAVVGRFGYRDPKEQFTPQENWDGVTIYRVGNPNWGRERAAKRLIGNVIFSIQIGLKSLFLPKPDISIVTTAPVTLPISAVLLKRFKKVPFVYIIYDLDPDRTVALGLQSEDSLPVRLLGKLQHRWMKQADKVVVIGRCMEERLVSRYQLTPEKIQVIPVGANAETIRPLAKDTHFRRKHGIQNFVVLYSGNFGQYHDFDTLLAAAEESLKLGLEISFVLVGNGKKREYVAGEVERRKLTNIRLFDFVPESELSDLLATADLSVVTLEPGMEGICVPSKFYSCLASGRPVLALMDPIGEVAREVEETSTGVRVPIGDVATLVSLLKSMTGDASDKALDVDSAGLRARELFESKYSIQKVAEQYAQVILRTLRAKSGSGSGGFSR